MLRIAFGLLLSLAILSTAGPSRAAEVQQTLIYVEDMHCLDCAKKIAGKLYTIPGVVGVRAIVDTGIAYVTPQQTRQPSPRAMWEAIEALDFKPVKIISPYGTFTSKPRQ